MKLGTAYKKMGATSYAVGVFPTLELLLARPQAVQQVVLAARGERNEGVRRIRALAEAGGIPVGVDDAAVERLGRSEAVQAVGVFEKYESALAPQANHLLLVEPSDRGNAGTIMRTMAGFGYEDLAVVRPAVDHFDPKTIRASMGAVFRLRVAYFDTFDDYQRRFGRQCYVFGLEGRQPLGMVAFEQPHTLVFGNEGAGLPPAAADWGQGVRIEQTEEVDSLNLAVAVGVVLHQAYGASQRIERQG